MARKKKAKPKPPHKETNVIHFHEVQKAAAEYAVVASKLSGDHYRLSHDGVWVDLWSTGRYRGCDAKARQKSKRGGLLDALKLLTRLVIRSRQRAELQRAAEQPVAACTRVEPEAPRKHRKPATFTNTGAGIVGHAVIKPANIHKVADHLAGAIERLKETDDRNAWDISREAKLAIDNAILALEKYRSLTS